MNADCKEMLKRIYRQHNQSSTISDKSLNELIENVFTKLEK